MELSSDPIETSSLPEAQFNIVSNLLNVFRKKNYLNSENLSSQDYIGLHDRLEHVSGVEKQAGHKGRTMNAAQRAAWTQTLLTSSRNANTKVALQKNAVNLSKQIAEREKAFSHLQATVTNDPRLARALQQFERSTAENIRQQTYKKVTAFFNKNPDLQVDFAEKLLPKANLARQLIDDTMHFAKDRQKDVLDLQEERKIDLEEMRRAQEAHNMQTAEIENLAREIAGVQFRWQDAHQSMQLEVDKSKRERTDVEKAFEQGRRSTEEKVESWQINLNTAREAKDKAAKEADKYKNFYLDCRSQGRKAVQDFTDLKKDYEAQEETLKKSRDEHTQLQRLFDALDKEKRQVSSKLETDSKTIRGLEKSLRENKADGKAKSKQAADSAAEVLNLKTKCQDYMMQWNADIDTLDRHWEMIKDLMTENASQAEEIDRLQRGNRSQIDINIAEAKELAELKKTMTVCQKAVSEVKHELTKSQRVVADLTTKTDNLQEQLQTAQQVEAERDELQRQMKFAREWTSQSAVYGEVWKLTIAQTRDYDADAIRATGISLNAANAFRESLRPENFRRVPQAISRIHGIGDIDANRPVNKGVVYSLFGRLHQSNCRISVLAIEAASRMLSSCNLKTRRLNLIFLFAFFCRRCLLVQQNEESCSFATSLVILRCVETFRCHLSGTGPLDLVDATFNGIKNKLPQQKVLLQAAVDQLTAKYPTLAQCLLSRHKFVAMPECDYKLSMDGDNLIVVKADHNVAYVHPSSFAFSDNFTEGYSIVFDNAPMVGTWTTPPWTVNDYFECVGDICQRAFDLLDTPEARLATRDTWLVDSVC